MPEREDLFNLHARHHGQSLSVDETHGDSRSRTYSAPATFGTCAAA